MTSRTLINTLRGLDPFTSTRASARGNSVARMLSDNVVWVERVPHVQFKLHEYPDTFYLVRSPEGKTAGIVYVMRNMFGWQSDLHAYVLQASRGRKLLYAPMRETILPHLLTRNFCQRDRACVMATIDSTQSTLPQAERSIQSLGFKKVGQRETVTQWELAGEPNPTFRPPDKWRSHSDAQVLELMTESIARCLQSIQLLQRFPEVNQERCKFLQGKALNTYMELGYAFQETEPEELPIPPEPITRDYEATRRHCMQSVTRLFKAAAAVEMFCKQGLPIPMEINPLTAANALGWYGIRDVLAEADYARTAAAPPVRELQQA